MDLEDRRRLADANASAAFNLVRTHQADPRGGRAFFGGVEAIAVGVQSAFFNPVLALSPETTRDDIRAAIAWIRARDLPASVQLRDDLPGDLSREIESLGLVAGPWREPVMVLDPLPLAPAPPGEVEIRVGQAELCEDLHAAIGSRGTLRQLWGSTFLADPRVLVAVAYLDEGPVAAAAALLSGSTIGIYAVGTLERARRRGLGRAVTWAAIDAGRTAWNGTIAVLQATEMGMPLYAAMGFEVVARYIAFEAPSETPTPSAPQVAERRP